MRKPRFIVTAHSFHRHETAAGAIAERNRLRELHPEKDFRVLTVIDEPTEEKLARDESTDDGDRSPPGDFPPLLQVTFHHPDDHIRATDLRPDDPFNGQCSIEEIDQKYRA
jgi:hypothetical protein